MPNETQEWRVSQAEFQGYVKANLEENRREHASIIRKIETQDERLNDLCRDITVLKVRAGIIGAIGAGIVLGGRAIIEFFANPNG